MDLALNVVVFANTIIAISIHEGRANVISLPQTRVDGRGCASPVFVQLETCDTCIALIMKTWFASITALTNDTEIDWQRV